jgi:trimeric autotransporter adhesin
MRNRTLRNAIIGMALTLPFLPSYAQQSVRNAEGQIAGPAPVAATALTPVPSLVPFSGLAIGPDGKALVGQSQATFLIYREEQAGEPLWMETQAVSFDSEGRYRVNLGATLATGLPTDLFSTGEARWLEVQVAGQAAQPRVLLVSVPYAMKAADSATLGGLPPSAFVLAGSNAATIAAGAAGVSPDSGTTVTTSGGTANKIAKFSGASTIVNSILYDNGTEVGIGTTSPSSTLTVDGTMTVDGTSTDNGQLIMAAAGEATTKTSYPSEQLKLYTSAYNSSSKAVVDPRFSWQAEPTGNDTSSPGATLNLQYSATGSAPSETGFHFGPSGVLTFAPGQTFPGTGSGNGTITGVTAGTGLTGGGTSGKVTLNVNTSLFPTLAGTNTFTGSNIFGPSIYEDTDVNIDNTNANAGGVSPGLRFGSASGEGIASQRASSGDNQYGLDFFTDYARRMSINEEGNVGIGTVAAEGIMLKVLGGTGAGIFSNSQDFTTLLVQNTYTGGDAVVFNTDGQGGDCVIDTNANLDCEGTLTGSNNNLKIDHPLDPANKYLVHASVESSELMNIYSGNVTTDELGVATVTLPNWFEAENGDFRYQLTTIGRDAHAWVSQEVSNGQFKIATNATNVKVSWQITAVRQDGYAKAHPLVAEQDKPAKERGLYRHPEAFGQPKEKGIAWAHRSVQGTSKVKSAGASKTPINATGQTARATAAETASASR